MLPTSLLLHVLLGSLAATSARLLQIRAPLHQTPVAVCADDRYQQSLADAARFAVRRWEQLAPWKINFYFVDDEKKNIYFCDQLQAGTENEKINYFIFGRGLPHPAYAKPDRPFKVFVDLDVTQTSQTLNILLLHEVGHVLGLQHTDPDTVMGYQFARTNNFVYRQEINFFLLTKGDVNELLRHENDEQNKNILFFHVQDAPSSLTEQRDIKCM